MRALIGCETSGKVREAIRRQGHEAISCDLLPADKAIASAHESISRDEATGEILSGGNRYLDIGYSQEARDAIAAQFMPTVEAALEKLAAPGQEGYLIPVEGTSFLLGAGRHGLKYGYSLWKDGSHDAEVCDLKEAATVIGMGGRRSR